MKLYTYNRITDSFFWRTLTPPEEKIPGPVKIDYWDKDKIERLYGKVKPRGKRPIVLRRGKGQLYNIRDGGENTGAGEEGQQIPSNAGNPREV